MIKYASVNCVQLVLLQKQFKLKFYYNIVLNFLSYGHYHIMLDFHNT